MGEVRITDEMLERAQKALLPHATGLNDDEMTAVLSAALSGMAEPVKPTTINVNDRFAVRLMNDGYGQLVKATTIWEDRSTGVKYAEACHPEQPDGTRHFQLHELMRFFGPLMFNGNNDLPFETTIEYLGDGLSTPPASDLASENERLRAGIKRLSDEEEMCAETTGDDPFSLVYLAAKLAKAEGEIERLMAVISGALDEMRLMCSHEDKTTGEQRHYYQGVDAARDTLEIYFKRHLDDVALTTEGK